jgi:hypothetical protein
LKLLVAILALAWSCGNAQTVVVEQSDRVVYDQVVMSFENRSVGMLPFFCDDEVDFSVQLSADTLAEECLQKQDAMENIRGLFQGVAFDAYTTETKLGTIIFLKIFMDSERPDYTLHVFFVVDTTTKRINRIHIE